MCARLSTPSPGNPTKGPYDRFAEIGSMESLELLAYRLAEVEGRLDGMEKRVADRQAFLARDLIAPGFIGLFLILINHYWR